MKLPLASKSDRRVEPSPRWSVRVLWLVAIWAASVLALGLVGWVLRLVLLD